MNICRLCLCSNLVCYYIFDEDILKKIKYLPIKIYENDNLPQNICEKCNCKLNIIYNFCNEAINSQKLLLVDINKQIEINSQTPVVQKVQVKTSSINYSNINNQNLNLIEIENQCNNEQNENNGASNITTINIKPLEIKNEKASEFVLQNSNSLNLNTKTNVACDHTSGISDIDDNIEILVDTVNESKDPLIIKEEVQNDTQNNEINHYEYLNESKTKIDITNKNLKRFGISNENVTEERLNNIKKRKIYNNNVKNNIFSKENKNACEIVSKNNVNNEDYDHAGENDDNIEILIETSSDRINDIVSDPLTVKSEYSHTESNGDNENLIGHTIGVILNSKPNTKNTKINTNNINSKNDIENEGGNSNNTNDEIKNNYKDSVTESDHKNSSKKSKRNKSTKIKLFTKKKDNEVSDCESSKSEGEGLRIQKNNYKANTKKTKNNPNNKNSKSNNKNEVDDFNNTNNEIKNCYIDSVTDSDQENNTNKRKKKKKDNDIDWEPPESEGEDTWIQSNNYKISSSYWEWRSKNLIKSRQIKITKIIDEPIKNYKICCICLVKQKSEKQLLKHYQKHKSDDTRDTNVTPVKVNNKLVKCTICYMLFNHEKLWQKHYTLEHNQDALQCSICRKFYNDPQDIMEHGLTHNYNQDVLNYEAFVCDLCPMRFHLKKEAVQHREESHPKNTAMQMFPCLHCSITFKKSEMNARRKHIFSHTKEFVFQCLVCENTLSSYEHYKIHMRKHTGYSPYKCSICKKRFRRNGILTDHMATHTGDKPYRCSICGKGFSQATPRATHERSHKGEKPFLCDTCGKSFVTQGFLNMHKKRKKCSLAANFK